MVVFATEATTSARDAQAHARAVLVTVIAGTITDHELSQVQAAKICRIHQSYPVEGLAGPDRQRQSRQASRVARGVRTAGRASHWPLRPDQFGNSDGSRWTTSGRLTWGLSEISRPFSDDSQPIYLDHHATTPVDPRVADVVMHAMTGAFGNANSIDHAFGEAAGALVATASEAVAALVGSAPEDVYFTSGSTEAIRLALAHAISQGRRSPLRVALTKVEHKAVIDAVSIAARSGHVKPCWIEVDAQGPPVARQPASCA